MANTPTTRLRLQKQGTGDNVNTWGELLNSGVFDLAEEAIAGVEAISLTGNKTLSSENFATDEARQAVLVFSDGGLAAVPTVTIPAVEKWYWIRNTGATYAITIDCGGVTASVPVGRTCFVYCDGTDVVSVDFVALSDAAKALAQAWATQLTTVVDSTDYSAKEYAIGDATASGGSAKAWAQDASSPDGTSSKSALTLANEAAASASAASGSASAAASSASTASAKAGEAAASAALAQSAATSVDADYQRDLAFYGGPTSWR